jgi:hypothetical protein
LFESGPYGVGPGNNGPEGYIEGQLCGVSAEDRLWDKNLSGYNDSALNPGRAPITQLRLRYAASIQTAWGAVVGPEHGFNNSKKELQALVLRPREVITQVRSAPSGSTQ